MDVEHPHPGMTRSLDLVASVTSALDQARKAKVSSQIVVHPIPERPFARIGFQGSDIVVVLPAPFGAEVRPVRLSSMNVDYGVTCKVLEDGRLSDDVITLIRLFSPTAHSESIFVEVIAMLLRPLTRFSQSRVHEIVTGLVELFQETNRVSDATLLGLWGELFVIGNASDPDTVGKAWHPTPIERFDFSLDGTRVEVKTTTGPRQHHFALEQVRAVPGLDIYVASVVASESPRGLNVVEMIPWVMEKINDSAVARHVKATALKTIGSSIHDQTISRIDLNSARVGLRYFESSVVPQPIAPLFGASQIRFVSDLQMIAPIDFGQVQSKGSLLRAISGTA
jgi:hypothetical protein